MKGILSKGLLLGFCIFLCGCAADNTICVDSCKLDRLISSYTKIQAENAELKAWRDRMAF